MKLNFITAAFAVALISSLSACKKTETITPTPSQTLVAKAGTDQAVLPTGTVKLDGSTSTGTGPLTYQWTVVRKPGNSNMTLDGASSATLSFNPDIVGYYELELTVRSGTEQSQDRVLVTVEYPTPLTLDKDITSKTRLMDRIIDPAKPDYIVTKDLATTAELTIDRGVVMAFERDKRLTIEKEGTLNATGVADGRIRFTGTQAQKSYWAGLIIYSPSTANALAFVDIEYAGSRVAFTGTKAGLALFGNNHAQISLTDSRFTSNDGYGLYVQDGALLRTFARNGFSKQTEAPVLIDAYNATRLDAASAFTGSNGRDVVEISSSAITGAQDVKWSAFGDKTPYRLLGNLTIEAGLTLQPGVIVEAARDGIISVNKGGYLSAKGTAEQKVTITGAGHTAAYWRGVIVYSVSNLTVLDGVEISGGGSAAIVSGQRALLTVYGKGAKTTVKNSRLSNSGGYAIMYTSDAELNTDAGSANTFSGNAQASLYKL
ncbi:right-handed parallel beta-helix repeat-containing protein [Fibrella sp. WM1]|uniref:PKD domain-containing protein n=1 Tax=Fibrella musci TaxID=3242485 RepID=UPI003522E74E